MITTRRRLLPVGAFLALCAGLGIAAATYRRAQLDRVRARARADVLAIATLQADRVAAWVEERKGDLVVVAGDPFIVEALAAARTDPAKRGALERWAGSLSAAYGYATVTLLAPDGEVEVSWPLRAGASVAASDRDLVAAAAASRTAVASRLDHDDPADVPHMHFAAPLRGADGTAAGAVLLRSDLERAVLPLIEAWPVPSPTAESLLVAREGQQVIFVSHPRHHQTRRLARRSLADVFLPAVQAALGREGAVDGRDYRGVPVIAAARQVRGTNLAVVSKIDESEVLAESWALVRDWLPVGAALAAVGGASLLAWARADRRAASAERDRLRSERDAALGQWEFLSRYANDVVLLIDDDGRVVDANDRASETYGYTRSDLVGMHVRDLRAAHTHLEIERQMQLAGTNGVRFETLHRRRDGTEFPVEVSSRTLRAGGHLYYQSIIRDITERRRAHDELAAAEESLRITLESIGDGVIATDEEGRVVRMNDVAQRLTGRTLRDARGRPVAEVFRIVNERTRGPVESPVDRVLREGLVVGLANHTALVRPDGTEIPISDSGAPIRDGTGRIDGVVLVFRDATEEREAQRVGEAQAKLLAAVNDAVIDVDPAWRIRAWNPAAERIYGYFRAEACGASFDVLRTEFEAGGSLEALTARVREHGAARVEVVQRRRDGERLRVELSAAALRDGDGLIEGFVVTCRDVTGRRLAEEAARANEVKFRTAFQNAGFGIAIADASGRILDVNRSLLRLLGAEAEALVGQSVQDLNHPKDRERSRALFADVVAGRREAYEDERQYVKADGTVAHVLLRASAVRGSDGSLQFVMGFVEDISTLKQVQAQLLFSDRMASVGTLAAGVAHEINNPLAYVLSNVSFLREELDRPSPDFAEMRSAVREVKEGAERVRDIVRDLKTFSRVDHDTPDVADVAQAIRSAVTLAQNEVKHRARLAVDVASVPPVRGSPHRIGQVLLNLLVNAAQSIAPGRSNENEIRITAQREADGRVAVDVRDTGAGIAPEVLPRIFEPFFTTKPVGEGTGLGLSICHGIIAALGGEIAVESEPGRGSRFRVLLPPADAPSAAPAPPAEAAPGRPLRLLVVDDEQFVATAVARILRGHHEVTWARGGAEALAALDGASFDAVLCDVMMPEMTGMDFFLKLREQRPDLAARTIFMSGGAFTHETARFLADVRAPTLTKPFDAAELRRTLEALAPRP